MSILPIDSGRYGSNEIRQIFEEKNRLRYQLVFEATVAAAQAKISLIPKHASDEINKVTKSNKVTLQRTKKLEAISDHDTAAIVEALSQECSASSKPWIHYGLTSNDVIDTSTSMQMRDAFIIIESKVLKLADALIEKALKFRKQPAVGRTHGQHTSIISFGLKFAVWAAEMARHIERIEEGKKRFLVCKTLGVVGTGSIMKDKALEVQRTVAKKLNLYPIDASTQVVPRERIAEIQFLIALIGCTLDKIAIEIRNLQRTEIREVAEPFKHGQIGSSAVPVKRNPIKSERVSSLAKLLRAQVSVAMENIPLWHERDLSNSANERFTIPLGAILLDEMLNLMIEVIAELNVDTQRIRSNLDLTRGQIYAEFVLDLMIKKGIPRFEAYRDIQRVAFAATETGEHFLDALSRDHRVSKKLTSQELEEIMDPNQDLGASSQIIDSIVSMVKESKKLRESKRIHKT